MITDPHTAVQNPSMLSPNSVESVIHAVSSNIKALMTSVNKPSVRISRGIDSSFTTGLIAVFTTVNTRADEQDDQDLCGRVAAVGGDGDAGDERRGHPDRDGVDQQADDEDHVPILGPPVKTAGRTAYP